MTQQYFNVHTHSFTMKNAPDKFLELYLPKPLAKFIDNVTDIEAGSFVVRNLLRWFGGNGGKRYASFLRIGKSRSQQEVFEYMKESYKAEAQICFIGLTMNMDFCGAGKSVSGFEGQLQEVLDIKKMYPDQLLLFLGIDPRWDVKGESIKTVVENKFNKKLVLKSGREVNPFVGLKIYPSMGFYPFDERLKETFIWAAENGVPVLSHCSYLGGVYNNDAGFIDSSLVTKNPYDSYRPYPSAAINYENEKKFWRWLLGRQRSTNNLNKCSYFMEPAAFDTMLGYFKSRGTPLKLCLAHFGGDNQIRDREKNDDVYGVEEENWFRQVKALMVKHESLYTDISYGIFDEKLHDTLISEMQNPLYGNRVMFGTDFFMTEQKDAEQKIYSRFKVNASKIPTANGLTIWDQAAGVNIEKFLKSKYFP